MGDKLNGSALPSQRAKFMDQDDAWQFTSAMFQEKLKPLSDTKYI